MRGLAATSVLHLCPTILGISSKHLQTMANLGSSAPPKKFSKSAKHLDPARAAGVASATTASCRQVRVQSACDRSMSRSNSSESCAASESLEVDPVDPSPGGPGGAGLVILDLLHIS